MLSAFVLQTQITKLATCPALTSDEVEKDWTRTHSCGVFVLGGDVVGEPLGVGDGLGDVVAVELGLGLGLGLELAEVLLDVGLGLEEVPDGDGEDVLEADVLGLDEGLLPEESDAEADGDTTGEAGLLFVAELPGDAEVLAGELLFAADAVSTASFGTDEHAALTSGALAVVTATAAPNMPKPKNMNPVSAPSAAGLRISALTCRTSLQ